LALAARLRQALQRATARPLRRPQLGKAHAAAQRAARSAGAGKLLCITRAAHRVRVRVRQRRRSGQQGAQLERLQHVIHAQSGAAPSARSRLT
jgi:hypothetical protein